MALERRPANPLPSSYVPPSSRPHKVTAADSLIAIAKANGLDPMALIEFNFKTRSPEEINWYLKTNVGCTRQTADGKNYVFSNSDSPGIIYLPSTTPAQPPPPGAAPAKPVPTGVWFGLGIKGGGMLVAYGRDLFEGMLFSADNKIDNFVLQVEQHRVGAGLGGSIAVALAIGTGAPNPAAFNGKSVGNWEWDFQFAVGNKWSAMAKAASKLPTVARIASVLKNGGKVGRIVLTVAERDDLRGIIKAMADAKEIDVTSNVAELKIIDLLGPGLEVSLYRAMGTATVLSVNIGENARQQ